MKKDLREFNFEFLHGIVTERALVIGRGQYDKVVVNLDKEAEFWVPIWNELEVTSDRIIESKHSNPESLSNFSALFEYFVTIFLYFKEIEEMPKSFPNLFEKEDEIPNKAPVIQFIIPKIDNYYKRVYDYCKDVLDIYKSDSNVDLDYKLRLARILNGYIRFYENEIVAADSSPKSQKNRRNNLSQHRIEALVYFFKAKYGCLTTIATPSEIESIFGAKRKQALYTTELWLRGTNYKNPTKEELELVIPLLSDCPNAQKAATVKLKTIG